MTDKVLAASRKLSKLNLNMASENIAITTYWCRVASSRSDEWNYKNLTHSFFELHLCLEGEGEFEVNGEAFKIGSREYLLIPPNNKHRAISATDDFSKFVWGFKIEDSEIANELAKAVSKIRVIRADSRIFPAIDIALDNAECDKFGSYGMIKNQLDYILKLLIRQNTTLRQDGEFSKDTSEIAKEMKKFIKDNLSEKLRVKDIADQFYLTDRQLEGICRREYKVSVSELKSELRLEKLKKLLAETELSLGKIAESCGFADQFIMSKFFRKHETMSPGKYRKACKE